MMGCKGRRSLASDERERLLIRGTWSLVLAVSLWFGGSGRAATVSVLPDADSFVRSFAPTNNYGAAGALSVSGSAAVNGSGDQNGLFDTVMRFPMSNVVASLDSALGNHDWIIVGAR